MIYVCDVYNICSSKRVKLATCPDVRFDGGRCRYLLLQTWKLENYGCCSRVIVNSSPSLKPPPPPLPLVFLRRYRCLEFDRPTLASVGGVILRILPSMSVNVMIFSFVMNNQVILMFT